MQTIRLPAFGRLAVCVATVGIPLVLLTFAGLRVSLALTSQPDRVTPSDTPASVAPIVAETSPLGASQAEASIKAFGRVRSVSSLEVRAAVPGIITETTAKLREGAVVGPGDLLFRIDPASAGRNLREADAALAQARAELAAAAEALPLLQEQARMAETAVDIRKSGVGRKDTLHAQKLTSRSLLDDALYDLTTAERDSLTSRQSVAAASARHRKAAADIERAAILREQRQHELEQSSFFAPFGGHLAEVSASPGRLVAVGEKLAKLIDTEALEVAVKLRLDEFARILDSGSPTGLRSLPVKVDLDLNGRTATFTGQIERSGAVAEADQATRVVYARIDDARGSALRPGDFVSVTISEPIGGDVVAVPREAVGSNNSILIVGSSNRLEEIPISVTGRQGGSLLIEGAPAGKDFIVTRHPALRHGTLVEPRRLLPGTVKHDG